MENFIVNNLFKKLYIFKNYVLLKIEMINDYNTFLNDYNKKESLIYLFCRINKLIIFKIECTIIYCVQNNK